MNEEMLDLIKSAEKMASQINNVQDAIEAEKIWTKLKLLLGSRFDELPAYARQLKKITQYIDKLEEKEKNEQKK